MYLDSAVFEGYRNIERFAFSFDPGINILYGRNAQGKTNVIEGIYLFGSGKSFRHAKERDLIKTDRDRAVLDISYVDSVRKNKMEYRMFRELTHETFKNGVKLTKMSDFIGNFKAVLFCPEHLSIVKAEPAGRRTFTDSAISQINRTYLSALIEYKKLLEQRNALLKGYEKQKETFSMTMEILSERLAVSAAYITCERARYLTRLFELVNASLSDMTHGTEHADFRYLSGIAGQTTEDLFDPARNTEQYRRLFSKDIRREIVMGTSLGGAHRDDFEILLNGMNAKFFASQGQQRSLALSMKLAEGEISREKTGEYPVFLLDDVLSELDRERKRYVLSELRERQVILTTCDESDFEGIRSAKRIYVENGNYSYQ